MNMSSKRNLNVLPFYLDHGLKFSYTKLSFFSQRTLNQSIYKTALFTCLFRVSKIGHKSKSVKGHDGYALSCLWKKHGLYWSSVLGVLQARSSTFLEIQKMLDESGYFLQRQLWITLKSKISKKLKLWNASLKNDYLGYFRKKPPNLWNANFDRNLFWADEFLSIIKILRWWRHLVYRTKCREFSSHEGYKEKAVCINLFTTTAIAVCRQ